MIWDDIMEEHYTIKRRGSKYAGYDVFCCNYCPHETHLFDRMMIHLREFHPQELTNIDSEEVVNSLADMPKAELVELAKEKGVAVYGSKNDIIERIQEQEVEE